MPNQCQDSGCLSPRLVSSGEKHDHGSSVSLSSPISTLAVELAHIGQCCIGALKLLIVTQTRGACLDKSKKMSVCVLSGAASASRQ